MISKKTLKNFEFKEIEEYYSYIIGSYINGNFKQVQELFKRLNKSQKLDFLDFLDLELKNKYDLLVIILKGVM
jgi:hypothetical protein